MAVSFLDRINERAVPVPITDGLGGMGPQGIDDWAPPEYGNYLATSNDVYSTAWLRAKMLSKLPIDVHRGKTIEQPNRTNLSGLLLRPNPFYTRQRLMIWTELSLAIWGAFAWICDRGEHGGRIREIWPVKPTSLAPVPHKTEYLSHYVYKTGDGIEIPLRPDEVVFATYPNPNDPYGPLAPMAAARLAADVASASMMSNRRLFDQGMMLGGFILPETNTTFTQDQAEELERLMGRRFQGAKNQHRWQVLRYQMKLQPQNITPKDAEFIDGMNLTFRQVCRAMGVPPPLVGDAEFATLANLRVYERMFWEHTGSFEADFIAGEIGLQLAPSFPGVTDVEFDLSRVVALQDDEDALWKRAEGQIKEGAITINEWREDDGRDPVAWGDVWWAPGTSRPVEDDVPPQPVDGRTREMVVSSRLVSRIRDYTEEEDGIADAMTGIFRRQQDAVVQKMKQQTDDVTLERTVAAAATDPFDMIKWTERTRAALDAKYVAAAEKAMLLEGGALALTEEELAAMLTKSATQAALEGQVRIAAQRVTTTTYRQVQRQLAKGVKKGETIEQLTKRVEFVFDGRVTNARAIAQTEVTRAVTTGQMAAFTQAGVTHKTWVTQGDEMVRDTHAAVNGTSVGVLDDFQVGAGTGPGPGRIDLAEETVNCRCGLEPLVVKGSSEPIPGAPRSANGEVKDLRVLVDVLGGSG